MDGPDLDKPFDPASLERGLYEAWEAANYFEPSGEGAPYSIAIPPPNITGTLHLGHGFQITLMDILIRYHRMAGYKTLWQVGTDHAGIATQMVVTEELVAQGQNPQELGRERFVERVWDWRDEFGGTITGQLRRLGATVDWNRERFTMDEGFSRAVIEVFVRLYEEGLIYKAKRLVNWDPQLETAISDLEVITEEQDGKLWHLRYPLEEGLTRSNGEDFLVVATTRPETMLGDTGIAVNPQDDRYSDLIGKHAVLPLVGRKLPIIADEYVDTEFGTGCLKITPAHDFNDYDIGTRHGLDFVDIFTSKALLNENVPAKYTGLDRFEARDRVLADLEAAELLHKVEDYRIQIPIGERSGATVEPRLTDQWFVDIKPLAEPAIKSVQDGTVKFQPKEWENVYFAWMNNIRDWTISRQQWWGHRIPAWYTEEDEVIVARNEEEARAKAGLTQATKLRRETDVLETWFSSALWTFGTLGWPDRTPDLNEFHPTDVLVTGHDIIFFWVARMIMMTLKFVGEVPFHTVYITGLIRDASGEKMSKTKGNGLDPLDVIDGISLDDLISKRTTQLTQPRLAQRIEKQTRKDFPEGIPAFGTDALRMTFAAMASPTRNYNFDLKQVEAYQNFCNKLWNASRFVFGQLEDDKPISSTAQPSLIDRWILTQTSQLIKSVELALSTYRFDKYAQALYSMVWHEYCDWYLEFSKIVLWDESTDPSEASRTRSTLGSVLDQILRITHPVMPYITEVLWLKLRPLLGEAGSTLLREKFPSRNDQQEDQAAFETVEWLKTFVTSVRTIRGERNIPPSREIPVYLVGGTETDKQRIEECGKYVYRLAHVESIHWLSDTDSIPLGSMEVLSHLRVLVPFLDQDEINSEKMRLEKEIERLSKSLLQSEAKLGNENFVQRAPAEVVEKERSKLENAQLEIETLQNQASRLETSV